MTEEAIEPLRGKVGPTIELTTGILTGILAPAPGEGDHYLMRVKLSQPGTSGGSPGGKGEQEVWARLVVIGEGAGRGLVLPELGTQMLVGVIEGDVEHPVVLGSIAFGDIRPAGLTAAGREATETVALAGLLLNAMFLPGLGSLITGNAVVGAVQLVMFLVGIPLCLSIIGLVVGGPLVVGAWLWAIYTGAMTLREAKAARRRLALIVARG